MFRPKSDFELSNWRPNRTPAEYRSGTETEICLRFLDNPRPGSCTLALNSHFDVDGILSHYVFFEHSQHAMVHRQTIIKAAEMGDFWGWGDTPSQRVFQAITRLMSSGDGKAAHTEAFRRIPALIDGTDPELPTIDESLWPLRRGVELVEQGRISRSLIADRLAHYIVPHATAGDDDERASYSPGFNEAISEMAILWPHVRARWDAQRVCLVSVGRQSGWFHDLWFPGYLWADTEGLWRVPGLTHHDYDLENPRWVAWGHDSYSMAPPTEPYELDNPRLVAAFEALQRQETAPGRWGLGGTQLPFGTELKDRFPLVGRFLDDAGQPATSHLSPQQAAKAFEGVFA